MNNLIKNIHDQMKPRKQVTDDLLRKIEEQQTEEVRKSGLSKLWVALPTTAAVAAVCVGIFVNLGGSKLETVGGGTDDSSDRNKLADTVLSQIDENIGTQTTTATSKVKSPDESSKSDKKDPDSIAKTSVLSDNEVDSEAVQIDLTDEITSVTFTIDKLFDDGLTAADSLIEFDSDYKAEIIDNSVSIDYAGRTYYNTFTTQNSYGDLLAGGTACINGEENIAMWVYEAESGSADTRLAVDLGDGEGIVFEAEAQEPEHYATAALTAWDEPRSVTPPTVEISQQDKSDILSHLGTIEFGGKSYYSSGGSAAAESGAQAIGSGTITVDGDMVYEVYVLAVGDDIGIDFGDHILCVYTV
ncbi:hypothetical protein [Ruminococcus sp. 210702-SL.1.03]|uniref:hypothetical protein n=1 Tax=Ruminococcus sp. 210702-SL.1.03 TaxID=2883233 RepID=UPI001D07955D|nr:hypothetical protein [Ruminococcus sp. 210702-SL.1.03]MCB6616608.1 hypothetical protein [Ruminococcus sp. 210702-SL.1.03]